MGQELFENPRRQYALYRVEELAESAQLGQPESPADGEEAELTLSEEQEALLEQVLEAYPNDAIMFDELAGVWIRGAEDDLNRMLADRDEFLDALEAGEDPGV